MCGAGGPLLAGAHGEVTAGAAWGGGHEGQSTPGPAKKPDLRLGTLVLVLPIPGPGPIPIPGSPPSTPPSGSLVPRLPTVSRLAPCPRQPLHQTFPDPPPTPTPERFGGGHSRVQEAEGGSVGERA